jgi:hypothetical protein
MLTRFAKLFSIKPAPTSSGNDNATSATTSAFRKRFRRDPAVVAAAPSFKASFKLCFVVSNAGARPHRTVVTTETKRVNPRTPASMLTSWSRGIGSELIDFKTEIPAIAKPNPSSPPIDASSALSVSSCRTTCQRLAPNASRITISRWRADARARVKLATFAQAISNTVAITPQRTHKAVCSERPTVCSSNGMTATCEPRFRFGNWN